METIVTVKCTSCDAKKEIKAGEIPAGEMPMCDICFSVMIADSAERK